MGSLKRYRIWFKDGTYAVGVGYTKDSALDYAKARGRIGRRKIVKVTLASH
jgi:hypothetical protein